MRGLINYEVCRPVRCTQENFKLMRDCHVPSITCQCLPERRVSGPMFHLSRLTRADLRLWAKAKGALHSVKCPFSSGLAPRAGVEPATSRLTAGCSTTELPGNETVHIRVAYSSKRCRLVGDFFLSGQYLPCLRHSVTRRNLPFHPHSRSRQSSLLRRMRSASPRSDRGFRCHAWYRQP